MLRKVKFAVSVALALLGLTGLILAQEEDVQAGVAHVLDLNDAVSPASADYIIRGLDRAAEEGAGLVILRMDTPGGLVTSTREINNAILSSDVPVATFVAPSGARAASAGTFIMYASHLAVMAPGTSVGAATPVSMGGGSLPFGGDDADEDANGNDNGEASDNGDAPETGRAPAGDPAMNKALNDAIAQIRSLAELHGRNADWAERAVRDAATLTASAAVEENVADFTARNLTELLDLADGRSVQMDGEEMVLATSDLSIVEIGHDLRTQILSIIANPNIAFLFMIVGFYGIVFELFNPGALVPGTIGGISLILGMFALSVLPFNFAGLALIGLGLALLVAEIFSPSFGILGIGGTIALAAGGVFLFDSDVPGLETSIPVLAAIVVASLAFTMLIARMAMTSHRRGVTTGRSDLLQAEGKVQDWDGTQGHVFVHGERWNARHDGAALEPGTRVRIERIDGLTLDVSPAAPRQQQE